MSKFAEDTLSKTLPRDTKPGEWDDGGEFQEAGPAEDVELEEPEEESDADELDSEEPDEGEPEEVEEPEADLEAEQAGGEEEDQEEEPQGSRANKRIRQLAAQNKGMKDQLAQVMAQFQATQQRDLEFRQHQYQVEQQARYLAQQKAEREAQFAQLQAQGIFDPTSKTDQFALTLHNDVQQLQAKLAAQEQLLQQQQYQAQWQEYHRKVNDSLRTSLKGYDVGDAELSAFHQQVVSVAVAQNLADPMQAVEQVVTPFLRFMSPKKKVMKPARVLTEPEKAAHRAVATRAPAGNKKVGQKVGGSHGRKTLKDSLDAFYGESEWG